MRPSQTFIMYLLPISFFLSNLELSKSWMSSSLFQFTNDGFQKPKLISMRSTKFWHKPKLKETNMLMTRKLWFHMRKSNLLEWVVVGARFVKEMLVTLVVHSLVSGQAQDDGLVGQLGKMRLRFEKRWRQR